MPANGTKSAEGSKQAQPKTPVQSSDAQGGEDEWERSIEARLESLENSLESLRMMSSRTYSSLRQLVLTYDTPSNTEKRGILSSGVVALNELGELLGVDEKPLRR